MNESRVLGLLTLVMLIGLGNAQTADAQGFRFQADWLQLGLETDTQPRPLIAGPDALTTSDDFNFEPGVRIFMGVGTETVELGFQYSRINSWTDEQSLVLQNELAFDSEFDNAVVFPQPTNVIGFANGLGTAGEFNGGVGFDETTEAEFLDTMSTAQYMVESNYDDFELTLKMSRFHRFRFGIGYRYIALQELNGLQISGLFQTRDADDGALPGGIGNGPNDILSNEAFVGVGFTEGAGIADGFAHGDDLLLSSSSSNDNRLNGAQLTFDGTLFENDLFLLDASSSVGIYSNSIQTNVGESLSASGSNATTYQRQWRNSQDRFAWAAQIGLKAVVKLTDSIRVHGGYEALYLDGLALGTNFHRVPMVSTGQISSDQQNTAVIHGGRLGLELLW